MMTIDLRKYETLGRLFLRFGGLPPALQKKNASPKDVTGLLLSLNWLLSLLLKAESIARLQLVNTDQNSPLLSKDPFSHLQFIKDYLDNFSNMLFSFNRSERQTLSFVIENVIEFMRQQNSTDKSSDFSTSPQFIDSRFWIENLFKMVDEKLLLNLETNVQGDLILVDSDKEIPLSPFIIKHNNTIYLFYELGSEGPLYHSLDHESSFIASQEENLHLAEFLIQSLSLTELRQLLPHLSSKQSPLLSQVYQIQTAVDFFHNSEWHQTITTLDQISEHIKVQTPLLIKLRIISLLNMQHSTEALNEAKLFLSRFPAYTSIYEVIAESYEQKGDITAALNAFERAAQFSRNRLLSARIKNLKQRIKDKKDDHSEESVDYLMPISMTEEQQKTQLKRPVLNHQMMEILASEHRPNLLLVGDGGVGKTSLLRQFVSEFMDNPHWHDLFSFKEIRAIQFVNLLTGSKYRGQFEEKVLALLNEAVRLKVLIVVEDIHLLFSQGGARGTTLDFINIIRPFLQDKRLQMVATTHFEELKNTLERDNAFMGCFHQMTVRPLNEEDTLEIMNKIRMFRSQQWGIPFPRELLPEVLELSQQHLRTRACPDAPLLLLDRVYAKMRLHEHCAPASHSPKSPRSLLAETIKEMSNLPAQPFGVTMQDRLKNLNERLASRIIGQEKVLSRLISRITAYKRGFKIRDNRPDGVFLLVGPTGVGKTETAIALAEELIGNRDALLRVDMSEYMEKYTYSRFIGAAPGYVGYNDTNQLTDKVRQNPMTIILLDEIEKADPQLLNIFLQVFDAGRLTDARGRVVDFASTIILMTSNVGTELYSASPLGYQEHGRKTQIGDSSLLKMVNKRFSPEFLNRIDDILVFSSLDDSAAHQIVELQLESIKKQLLREGKLMMVTPTAIAHLARKGINSQYGARQLTRIITQALLEPLAQKAMSKEWYQGDLIYCDLSGHSLDISIQQESQKANKVIINDCKEQEYEMECDP